MCGERRVLSERRVLRERKHCYFTHFCLGAIQIACDL